MAVSQIASVAVLSCQGRQNIKVNQKEQSNSRISSNIDDDGDDVDETTTKEEEDEQKKKNCTRIGLHAFALNNQQREQDKRFIM